MITTKTESAHHQKSWNIVSNTHNFYMHSSKYDYHLKEIDLRLNQIQSVVRTMNCNFRSRKRPLL